MKKREDENITTKKYPEQSYEKQDTQDHGPRHKAGEMQASDIGGDGDQRGIRSEGEGEKRDSR
jgi:hypothetical protein